MGNSKFKRMLSWGWEGVKVWSALSSLGATTMLRAVFQNTVSGWVWYDQLFLFGGLFLLLLGILAFISQRRIKQSKTKSNNESDAILSPEEIALRKTSDLLLEILAFNQQNIYEAVKGRIIGWRFSGINSPDPYFEICLEEINTSIFTVHFIGGSGSLFVNGIECQQQPKINEQWGLEQGKTFEVTVKQGVSKDVADIVRAASNKQNIKFDLRQFHLHFETTTKGYEGFKLLIKFGSEFEVQPNINTNLLVLHRADYRI